MKLNKTISAVLLVLASHATQANDFPTLERVDGVLTCMAAHGGQTVENLYACSCKVDVIASMIPFETWDEARTFKTYKRLPGEKGGMFRDSDRADELIPLLDVADKEGEKRCFVGVKRPAKKAKKTNKKAKE